MREGKNSTHVQAGNVPKGANFLLGGLAGLATRTLLASALQCCAAMNRSSHSARPFERY